MSSGAPAYDAIVVGGNINGLVAAACLAKAGRRTLILESSESVGGSCRNMVFGKEYHASLGSHIFHALDPRVIADLKLVRLGLKFAVRDVPLVAVRAPGEYLVLSRDARTTRRSIAAQSKADAEAWPKYRNEMFTVARAMRPFWWDNRNEGLHNASLERLTRTSTTAWLDAWFESDTLKGLLAFDAAAMSPLEAGSALALAWRAAQEMCGLQGAAAIPVGGAPAVVSVLGSACDKAGVETRTNTAVARLCTEDGRTTGVALSSGETITAALVLSSLSRRTTLLALAGGGGLGIAERQALQSRTQDGSVARVVFVLDRLPELRANGDITSARLVLAERVESYAAAHAAARLGAIPDEPILEVTFPSTTIPSLAPHGSHIMAVSILPVPREPAMGWQNAKVGLAAKALGIVNRHVPGVANRVVAAHVITPQELDDGGVPPHVRNLLAPWHARVGTPIEGLFLCGLDAEPYPAVSGRAGRIAAQRALAKVQRP